MEKAYDMIVIGGGPAGYTAALYAARAEMSVLVIEKLFAGGQMTLTGDIENYPGFDEGIDGPTLGMKMQNGAAKAGAESTYGEVLSVNLSDKIKEIVTDAGTYYAKTVVIATGAYPRELGVEGEQKLVGRGVHYCAHCDGRFYKDKTVAVVGGGNSAAEDALYLSKIAKKVYLIHRRDSLRAERVYQKRLSLCENVEFVYDTTVKSLEAEKRLQGIVTENLKTGEKKRIEAEGLFVSIGRAPATDFLKGSILLSESGYIVADETTKTSIEGVFAAGDVRTKTLRQVVTAVADGAVAANEAMMALDK